MSKYGSITLTDYTEGSMVYFSVDNYIFPADEDGQAVEAVLEIEVTGYLGDQESPVTIGTPTDIPTGMTISVENNGTVNPAINVSITEDLTNESGAIIIPVTINGITFEKSFSYTLVTNWTSAISGLSSIVDTVNQSIEDKVWRTDIVTVEDLNGNTVQKSIEDILVQSTSDLSGINNTVSSLKTTQDSITGDITSLESEMTEISQKADQISLLVDSTSSSSSLILTDNFVNLLSGEFNVDALTTFMNSAKDGSSTIIDGGAIIADSISVDKLNIEELAALNATIGGFTISDNSLYTNNKTSYSSTVDGVYVGDDGIGCGDFYATEDGSISLGAGALTYNSTNGLVMTGDINATAITAQDSYSIYTGLDEKEIITYEYEEDNSGQTEEVTSTINFGIVDKKYSGDPYIEVERILNNGVSPAELIDSTISINSLSLFVNSSNTTIGGTVNIGRAVLEILNFSDDNGWDSDFTYESNFSPYSSSQINTNYPIYRKYGNIVELRGAFTNINAFSTTSDPTPMASLPFSISPSSRIVLLQQGSGANTFTLTITSTGDICISRYGTTTTSGTVSANSWLNIHCIFLLG